MWAPYLKSCCPLFLYCFFYIFCITIRRYGINQLVPVPDLFPFRNLILDSDRFFSTLCFLALRSCRKWRRRSQAVGGISAFTGPAPRLYIPALRPIRSSRFRSGYLWDYYMTFCRLTNVRLGLSISGTYAFLKFKKHINYRNDEILHHPNPRFVREIKELSRNQAH